MAERVLLLGSTGFVGRHVRMALEAAGHDVVGVATTATGEAERGMDLATGDPGGLIAEVDPSTVVNCAGRTSGSVSELVLANTVVVARLIDALSGRGTRVVQVGSSAEYGAGERGRRTLEDDPPKPVSAYGASKLAATQLVVNSDIDAVVLRVFNPLGNGSSPSSLPGRAARLIRDGIAAGSPSIHLADLGAQRDFIDVRDVADAVQRAVIADDPPRLVNIGSGTATTARELVRAIAEIAGYEGSIDEDAVGSPRSASVGYQVADVTLARAALAWAASHNLHDAAAALWSGIGEGS